jgi:1-acyl-sn-glycerol-3-phosphate acyltransferase
VIWRPYPNAVAFYLYHAALKQVLIALYGPCSFVAKSAIAQLPIIGTVATAMQAVYVGSGRPVAQAIISRAQHAHQQQQHQQQQHQQQQQQQHQLSKSSSSSSDNVNQQQQLMKMAVFPEGTTTNGQSMIKCRTGVFAAGVSMEHILCSACSC